MRLGRDCGVMYAASCCFRTSFDDVGPPDSQSPRVSEQRSRSTMKVSLCVPVSGTSPVRGIDIVMDMHRTRYSLPQSLHQIPARVSDEWDHSQTPLLPRFLSPISHSFILGRLPGSLHLTPISCPWVAMSCIIPHFH